MKRDPRAVSPAPAVGLAAVPAADAPARRGLRSLWLRLLGSIAALLHARRIARTPPRHASLGVISRRSATPTLLQANDTARIYPFSRPARRPR